MNSWPARRGVAGIYCASRPRSKASPITCVLVTKRPFPRSRNPRVTGDLFESRYWLPRDCEAYPVARYISAARKKYVGIWERGWRAIFSSAYPSRPGEGRRKRTRPASGHISLFGRFVMLMNDSGRRVFSSTYQNVVSDRLRRFGPFIAPGSGCARPFVCGRIAHIRTGEILMPPLDDFLMPKY